MRAWHVKERPVLLCPAMNTAMWLHPLTQQHLDQLKEIYTHFTLISPTSKQLACGDTGYNKRKNP